MNQDDGRLATALAALDADGLGSLDADLRALPVLPPDSPKLHEDWLDWSSDEYFKPVEGDRGDEATVCEAVAREIADYRRRSHGPVLSVHQGSTRGALDVAIRLTQPDGSWGEFMISAFRTGEHEWLWFRWSRRS